ncbi:hypothetical protein B0H10DRAFT_2044464 [Mycena sp. CBHHK59/15]|nr:hypothetical protein B0H10DRAFT_2044464 [Mycena sp. CBHHK59/15]
MAFLVTNFWEHNDMERMPIDAAKSAGVGRIVWSALCPKQSLPKTDVKIQSPGTARLPFGTEVLTCGELIAVKIWHFSSFL